MSTTERALVRIAVALEELVELSRPKPVDMEAVLVDATEALRKSNPAFDQAFSAIEEQMKLSTQTEQGKIDAP